MTLELRFRVSPRLKQDWETGREYYALDGETITPPAKAGLRPLREGLEWHGDEVFLG